jgi:hypothetical protein
MTLLRGLLLAGSDENLCEANSLLAALPDELTQDSDRARVECYRLWFQIRKGCYDDALRHAHELLGRRSDVFSIQFAARAAADAVLADSDRYRVAAQQLLSILRAESMKYFAHPGDLIWRDIGVLEHCCGKRRSVAAECFERSLAISEGLPECPANLWNQHMAEIHASQLAGSPYRDRRLPAAAEWLREKAVGLNEKMDLILAYRRASPY